MSNRKRKPTKAVHICSVNGNVLVKKSTDNCIHAEFIRKYGRKEYEFMKLKVKLANC
jgi:hypothetical protein